MRSGRLYLGRLALAALLAACGGGAGPPSSATPAAVEGDEPGSTRASREAARSTETSSESPAAVPEPRAVMTIVVLGAVADAEDGRGARVAATEAVAVDLDARRFPPRALDPVLEVGALRFVHYQHPEPGVLRFVLADRALLDGGTEIAIQYGDDVRGRIVLAHADPSLGGTGGGTVAP